MTTIRDEVFKLTQLADELPLTGAQRVKILDCLGNILECVDNTAAHDAEVKRAAQRELLEELNGFLDLADMSIRMETMLAQLKQLEATADEQ